jgi:hypothetical protein
MGSKVSSKPVIGYENSYNFTAIFELLPNSRADKALDKPQESLIVINYFLVTPLNPFS